MRKALFALAILAAAVPCLAELSGGGTEADPYVITSLADFDEFAADSNYWAEGVYTQLTCDINLAGRTYTTAVIWDLQGVFDGNDHVLRNLVINSPAGSFIGLFGSVGPVGRILNLGVEDANVSGSSYVGVLASYSSGDITSCYVIGAANATSTVGGLVGYSCGTIADCYATGDVNAGAGTVGGLVGYSYGGTITNCYTTGSVFGGDYSEYIGGFVGRSEYGSFKTCYAISNVVGKSTSQYMGGLIGHNRQNPIANCYTAGNLVGGATAGGLVGYNQWSWITDSFSTVEINGSSTIGGLVGYNYRGGIRICYAAGFVSGVSLVGGLVGRNYHEGISSSYFLDANDGGGPDNGYGTSLTDMQMQQRMSFDGFDFVGYDSDGTHEIWTFPEGGGYPVLSSFQGYVPHVLDGIGTHEDPYLVSDVCDLGVVLRNPNASYKLVADLNLLPVTWSVSPIPEFSGTFDGDNHILYGLSIHGAFDVGLFGIVTGGSTINDVRLENIDISGTQWVGGLVGRMSYGSSITNCYATGQVNGAQYTGGLVGHLHLSSIAKSFSAVSVIGTNFLGGLVGQSMDGNIMDCYTTGTVMGTNYLGGLVGDMPQHGTIERCYAIGSVEGDNVAGGLLGRNDDGNVADCYFLDPNDGGGPDNGYGEPLTDGEMKQQANFIDWDFNDVWFILEDVTYPFLQWQNSPPVADAGPNTIAYACIGQIAEVQLDGSASFDEDSDPLTYLWTWTIDSNTYDTNGVSPIIDLPPGEHLIQLIVNDRLEDSDPNYVTITVIPPLEARLHIIPRIINPRSRAQFVFALMTLPADVTADQIDTNEPLIMSPGRLESVNVRVVGHGSRLSLIASFSRAELVAALGPKPGRHDIDVAARLLTGQCILSHDTIMLLSKPTRH